MVRRESPGRAEWTDSVRRILTAIDAGEVRKVVLARQLVVEAGVPFDRRAVLDRLRRSHPSCFTYAAGGFVGAGTAVAKGSRFVRVVFVVVLVAFIVRIGGSVLGLWS